MQGLVCNYLIVEWKAPEPPWKEVDEIYRGNPKDFVQGALDKAFGLN